MKLYSFLFIAAIVIAAAACKKTENGNPIPVIAYGGMSKDSVISGSKDTLSIKFTLTDGDGDVRYEQDSMFEIYLKDSRSTTGVEMGFKMPEIPAGVIKDGESVDMHCVVNVSVSDFLLLRPSRPQGDTLSYDIYFKDKAGHKSNTITTHPIYIYP